VSAQNAAPVLALVPPGPPLAPAPAHAPPIDWPRRSARIRGVAATCCWVGAITPLFAIAAAQYVGGAVYPVMFLCWCFLLGCGGLVVFLNAMITRSRADRHAMISAVLALVLAIALTGPGARVGTEAFVSSHAGVMDRAAAAWVVRWTETKDGEKLSRVPELNELGVSDPVATEGGVWFRTNAPFAPDLFYADATLNGAGIQCDHLTPIGGRWYLWRCGNPTDYEDW